MFFTNSPLNYPTNAQTAIRRYKSDRAPTTFDIALFELGDEWLDTTSQDWYKLVSKEGGQANWCVLCGSGTSSEEFLPDSGTSPVIPNASNQVTMTGGAAPRAIEVIGGLNTLTFSLNTDVPGTRCFTCPAPSEAEFCWVCEEQCTTLRGFTSGFTGTEWFTCQAGVQTTDATLTTLASITLVDLRASTVKAYITGARADHSAALSGDITYGARRAGGGAVEMNPAVVNVLEDGGATVAINASVSSNDILITCTGEAATTWNWVTTYSYQILNTNA